MTSPNLTMSPSEPSDLIVSVIFSCYILYAAAILFGIPCNVFVLFRMAKLSKKCSDMYSNGAGLCLFVMAVADIGSLLFIFIHYILSISTETYSIQNYVPSTALNVICKLTTFSMHISTFVSIWSWLLMSTLRYLSVYHPLLYIRLWRLPFKVMLVVVCFASLFNLWLLIAVVNDPQGGCTMTSVANSPLINKTFLLLESVASFIVPTLTIVYVDASVLCGLRFRVFSPRKLTMEADLRKNVSPRIHKHHRFLSRWLVIALIDIGLNAPENLSRLGLITGILEYSDSEIFYIYRIMAQVPYYLQFGFNGVYLALFIYDKSTRPTKIRVVEGSMREKQREMELLAIDGTNVDSGIEEDAQARNPA